MRRPPTTKAPDSRVLRVERAPLFDLEVSVVTPLFGGSATPAVADPLQPVRAASVRGHLRFWWRACRGSIFTDVHALYDEEEGVWGSTTYPSPVGVTVSVAPEGTGTLIEPREYQQRGDKRFPAYALFPYQEIAGAALEGVRFRLCITVDTPPPCTGNKPTKSRQEIEQAVEAALWAWFTFGGIGARTRRGCGSLFCSDFAPSPSMSLPSWLNDRATKYIVGPMRRIAVPSLHGARLVVGKDDKAGDSLQSWRDAVNMMRGFRQAPEGRREAKVPGRSRWPEADSVRRAVHRFDPERPREHKIDSDYYPRADFGLPIIFRFKQNKQGTEPPHTYSLERAQDAATPMASRMASPIILKPLALSLTKAVPLILCLDAPHIWEMGNNTTTAVLKEKTEHGAPRVVADLSREQLYAPALSPRIPPLSRFHATNARDAFMAYAAAQLQEPQLTFGV